MYKKAASSKGKYQSKKGYSKKPTGSKSFKENDKYPKEEGSNDPAWYAANQSLLRDAASIPYSWPIGTPIDLSDPVNQSLTNRKFTVPGIQTIYLQPSVGFSSDPSSPINVASNANYAFVRHENSGHANYDAPDLMLYIMSMTQVYSYIVFLQRVYGAATLYAQKNRYLPDALLKAMRVNSVDVLNNIANLRYGINILISKAASFAVPSTMTVFARHAFLYGSIYTEGNSIKDQLYMYSPAAFWKYKWDDVSQAGKLETVPFTDTEGASVDALLAYGNDMLNRLIYDEDINIMSGDILKAYKSDVLKLAPLQTDYPMIPIYNLGVLEQMKNTTPVGNTIQNTDINQNASKAWLTHEPRTAITATGTPWVIEALRIGMRSLTGNRIITTSFDEATPEVTMENTRLTVGGFGYAYTAQTSASCNIYCGSEIPVSCSYFVYNVATSATGVDTLTLSESKLAYVDTVALSDMNAVEPEVRQLLLPMNFKYRPAALVQTWTQVGTTSDTTFKGQTLAWDVDNYAVLTAQDIRKLHEAALMNELAVPSIGKM